MKWNRAVEIGICIASGFLAGWLARSNVPDAPPGTTAPLNDSIFAALPDVRQSTGYSCGSAVLQAVFSYYGIDEREDTLMKMAGTTEAHGTSPAGILRVARQHGLRAELREGLALGDLQDELIRGVPVIVAIQAWREGSASNSDWSRNWEDGHYVIVVGLDPANVIVEDPSLLGCRGAIPRAEFMDRWHDYEGEPPFDREDRAYVHMGIFIESGKPPAPVRHLCPVN